MRNPKELTVWSFRFLKHFEISKGNSRVGIGGKFVSLRPESAPHVGSDWTITVMRQVQ